MKNMPKRDITGEGVKERQKIIAKSKLKARTAFRMLPAQNPVTSRPDI
jgi:hypothetical protein